jgi:dihydroorotate dehydrogenase (NAD+) catalytic subunit
LLAVGVLAVWRVRQAVSCPVFGAGGVQEATDIVQFLMAGARAVMVGTAALVDPKLPARLVRDLDRWCERHRVARVEELIGTLQWPT